MSDQTVKLIKLIKEGKTCNDICGILGISNKQLFNNLTNLRNKGFFLKRKYYSNGVIVYYPIETISDLNRYHERHENAIITAHSETYLKCLVISDLHFGNQLERTDLIDKAYEYCINNNIHIILCCGDLIDGTFTRGEQRISDIYLQIDHFIHDDPFDKNILTFSVAGDHDASALNKTAQDIIEIASNYRHDIIIGGYGNYGVYIKNERIALYHPIGTGIIFASDSSIVLKGHSHKYAAKLNEKGDALSITVPSLSDINDSFPTAVELTLQFRKGYIDFAVMKQIYFIDRPITLSEIKYDLLAFRNVEFGAIKNEEAVRSEYVFKDVLKKEKTKTNVRKSQIEKFSERYGIQN